MMNVKVGDVRKGRLKVCDGMGSRVEEGSWAIDSYVGSLPVLVWRHRRRQAVT